MECKTLFARFTKSQLKCTKESEDPKENMIQEMNWLAFTVITRYYYQITNQITGRMVIFFYAL